MNTGLNLGLNDETVEGLAKAANDRRFAYDSYRRFIQMFADVVLGVDHHHFEEILELAKEDRGYLLDTELTAEDWAKVIEAYKAKVKEETGAPFPQEPKDQVWAAIGARSEEHTSALQSLMRTSYAVFCLKQKNTPYNVT